MAWIAITDHTSAQFDAAGLGAAGGRSDADVSGISGDALVAQGSLVIETDLSPSPRPHTVLAFAGQDGIGFSVRLQAVPGGGLAFVIANGEDLHHATVPHCDTGRTDTLRLTFAWDSPARRGYIAVERNGTPEATLHGLAAPRPVRLRDLRDLSLGAGRMRMAQEIAYIAVATHLEPVGPEPTLAADTPVATPRGYRAIGSLRRGDTVLTPTGAIVPVLQRIDREVPARGMRAPMRLRHPYFGLKRDITVSPEQRLLIRGSDVEYLFGQEAVLAPARHFAGAAACPVETAGTIRYCQLLLPEHEPLDAAGTETESLFIGRLRRKRALLDASVLAELDGVSLPDHGASVYPVLRPYDARVLADYRAA